MYYNEIAIPHPDSFDSFDEYSTQVDKVDTMLAPDRRKRGQMAIAEAGSFLTQLKRKAEIAGKTPAEIMVTMLENNPESVAMLRHYVYEMDYTPAANLYDLVAQVAHARKEQIIELQEHYNGDNYDADADCYTSRKTARRERREAKFKRRATRRATKAELKEKEMRAQIGSPAPEEVEEATEEQINPAPARPSARVYATNEPQSQITQSLANPSEDEAQAEIIGEEMEGTNYVGSDNYDCFLPFLAGAIQVGGDLISGAKAKGADFSNIKTLFKKKPTQAQKDAAAKIPSAKLPEVLNKGIKEIVDGIEAKKKQDFLRENMVYIILAVVIVFIVGKNS